MNLYLKYRPKTIDELDLAGVRKTLGNIVSANSINHAYLLTGPRGAGKTSTARVLARIVNCDKNGDKLGEPCNNCSACKSILEGSAVDVIEIDAASNRGIDDIRELKEKIRLAPAILRRKVYIIDEVHMLTTEAFNALLKTLEEPPSHSLFILCTTELHKVPETIVSRCVQIQFTKATPAEMQRSFQRVVKGEGKKVSEEALVYLSKAVDGSFRDGVKILDQVLSNSNSVEIGDIEQVVSGSAGYKIESLINALASKNVSEALLKLDEAIVNGVDLTYLLVGMMRGLRDRLVADQIQVEATKLVFSLDEVARRLSTSLDGELLIQVAIVEWCGTGDTNHKSQTRLAASQVLKSSNGNEEGNADVAEVKKTVKTETVKQDVREVVTETEEDLEGTWKKIVGGGHSNLALDTILSKARAGKIQGDELTVYVQYDFHRQQLMSEKNRAKFEEIITSAVGRPMKVKCEVAVAAMVVQPENKVVTTIEPDGTIDEAMAIFS